MAYNVSFSSKVVSRGSVSSWFSCQPLNLHSTIGHTSQSSATSRLRAQTVPFSSSETGPSPASSGYRGSCPAGQPTSAACSTPSTGTSCFGHHVSTSTSFLVQLSVAGWSSPCRAGLRHKHGLPPGLGLRAQQPAPAKACAQLLSPAQTAGSPRLGDSRNHLLEVPQCGLDIGAGGYIVLDLVDERGVWDPSWVGGGVFSPVCDLLSALCSHLVYMFSEGPLLP